MTNEMRKELATRIETNPLGWLPVVGNVINVTFTPEEAALLVAALRAQSDVRSPAPQGEPVAWTNEAQLGFLKDPGCAEMPMAMWAKSSFYSQVPLYTAPVPPADLAEVLENVRVSIGKIADGRRGDGVPPELYRACHALAHMTKDLRS